MRKRFIIAASILCLALVLDTGCVIYGRPGRPKTIPKGLTFLISSNTSSNYTPCGCHSGKYGGMPRRGSIFEEESKKVQWPVLIVDTGDVSQGSTSDMQAKKDKYIFQAYDIIGYDIVNLGYTDLGLGYEELARIGQEYRISWVSANTYAANVFPDLPAETGNPGINTPPGSTTDNATRSQEGNPGESSTGENPGDPAGETAAEPKAADGTTPKPLFAPYVVVEPEGAPGYKVGMIGVMIQDAGRLNPKRATFSFEPYEPVIKEAVETLRNVEHVDLIVLVCDADGFEKVDAATAFAGVDIVIGGRNQLERSPNTLQNPLNPLSPEYKSGDQATGEADTSQQPQQPQSTGQETAGDSTTGEQTAMAPITTPLLVPKAQGRGRFVTRFDVTLDSAGRIVDYYFDDQIKVDDTHPDDPRMAEVSRGYDTEVLAVELMTRVEMLYTGSAACEQCHPGYLAAWADHGHFHAYQRIVDEGQLADRECTRCHAIGFVEEPRLLTYDLIKETHRDVGCEGCHPNGKRHVSYQTQLASLSQEARARATAPDAMQNEITSNSCILCHTGKWGQGFNFDSAMQAARSICMSIKPSTRVPDNLGAPTGE